MFNFKDYEDDILRVASLQKVDVGVAFDKFRADVACGKANDFNTGNALAGFDFAGAKKLWDMLTVDEQIEAVAAYRKEQKRWR